MSCPGELVRLDDTSLWVVPRGPDDGYPVIVLHGGPGLDHHEFADYLDPLTADGILLLLVDQRAQGRSEPCDPRTWTLVRHAQDVIMLARAMQLGPHAVLGHSYGAFVALQHAVDFPGMAAQTIVSCGVPSTRWFAEIDLNLERFEPEALRQRVMDSWAREESVQTPEELRRLDLDQLPFQFGDPLDPRIDEYAAKTADTVYSPGVLRDAAAKDYGGIEVEPRLDEITEPVLVLAGRHDRTCPPAASEFMAAAIPSAELVVFESSGHMPFVEEPGPYLEAVGDFLRRTG
jgi:pimeloyl-ACP methyl ester carboxylesterase